MYWTILCYHPYLVSMLFADLLSLHLVTFLMFFILVHVTFLSSRCMLELKFAIYYRAASLPSQASYAVLAEESQAFFKLSQHTNSISNSAISCNNYISLLSDLARLKKKKKKEKHFSRLATFWFGAFVMLFSATGCVFHHENTRKWTVGCYNGL